MLAILFRFATVIGDETCVMEVITAVAEVLRTNFCDKVLKAALLAALGEALFYVTSQVAEDDNPVWDVPASTFTLLKKCLRPDEVCIGRKSRFCSIVTLLSLPPCFFALCVALLGRTGFPAAYCLT